MSRLAMPRLRELALGSLLIGAHFGAVAEPYRQHFDVLYIDANVGMSSGGHVALRIGDEVFHYQHDADGFIALAREEWRQFRLIYNDLDNRNIHVARVELEAEDLERIRHRFVQRHLIQNRHLDFLVALRKDRELLQRWQGGDVPRVAGAGLFVASEKTPPDLQTLSKAVASRLGAGFLRRNTAELERLLTERRYTRPKLDAFEASDSRYPGYPDTFSEIHFDTISKLAALRILSGGWSPVEEAFLDPGHYGIPDARIRLSHGERSRLEALELQLHESIFALLASPRSDWGFPLLLATARYLAVKKSRAVGHLILIHPFFGLTANLAWPDTPERRRSLTLLSAQLAASFRDTREAFFHLEEMDETSLNLLENTAARYFETHRAMRGGQPMRLPPGFEQPRAPGPVRFDAKPMTAWESARAIEEAEEEYLAFRTKLQAIYPYNLIARNCATELVRTLNSAFSNEHEAVRALGAVLNPDDGSVLIPFRLFDQVSERLRVARRGVLPSYRNRTLAAFSEKQNPLWIYLAESNTASSSLYRRRRGDTLFLMFTEDVWWLRPLFGTVNLGYGLVNAGTGLLTAPLDRGERVTEGFRGALFSLPELAFFNIRKGSFAATGSP